MQSVNDKWTAISVIYSLIWAALLVSNALVTTYLHLERKTQRENASQFIRLLPHLSEDGETSQSDADATNLELAALWTENRERLEIYHQLVTGFARSTRLTTIITIVTGFLFIVLIGVIGTLANAIPGAITSSNVAASGAILTGFIGKAVISNSASSQRELLAFFNHPIEVERALRAERLIDQIDDPEKKAAAQVILLQHFASSHTHSDVGGSSTTST
ncbi:hypothetical protein [Rhodococcus sp. 077-4]|uniref:hypothetical protein n=1 Tax=Rhodococcus sp. 077-4 TaxID=2789271 RepID=UPI0039F4F3A9